MITRPDKSLASYTPARVGLQSTGVSLVTREVLDFQLAHAQARDAVHAVLDIASLGECLRRRKLSALFLNSCASNRSSYLRNPNLGRSLNEESTAKLPVDGCDLVFVIADGLSALAVERHALPLLDAVLPLLSSQWNVGPISIVQQGRVAIGDAVGEVMQAEISVVLIGERPGLSSADSLGAYITWRPRRGRTDAERNCISNIRPEGLNYDSAAYKLAYFLNAARTQKLTGVALKGSSSLPSHEVLVQGLRKR